MRLWTSGVTAFAMGVAVEFAFILAGCSGSSSTTPSPVAAVSAAETALAAAGQAVMACYGVAACEAKAVSLSPQIKAAYDAAYTAVTAAQTAADAGGSPDMTAATAAMSALQGLVAQLPQPKT